jgi:GMP reductase
MVKVGIGPGGLCETRNVTGVGYPQLQAVQDCSKVCRVMADGGLRNSGDFSKAFVAGADMVMAGSFFLSNCLAYGMASSKASAAYGGTCGNNTYRAWEGKEKVFEDKGSLDDIILQLLGGIRSSCTYCNATGIEGLKKNGRLIKVK